MTNSSQSKIESAAGRALYRLLPAVYRVRDGGEARARTDGGFDWYGGDFARYLDACGVLLDQVRGTIEQLLADQAPDTDSQDSDSTTEGSGSDSQTWVLPYLADLFDVRVISPHTEGRRLEIQKAIRWRQRSGTLGAVDEISEAFVTQQMVTGDETGPGDIEVQEGISKVAVTPRVDLTGRVSDATPPDTASPDDLVVPWVTPDTRRPSRALRVDAGTPGARHGTFAGEDVHWLSTHPAGAPCFPGSYQDRSRLTPDMRSPTWKQGHSHPRRVLLYVPPREGFFPVDWEDNDNVSDSTSVDASSGDVTISDQIVTDTLTVTAGTLEIERCAVRNLVVRAGAGVVARDSLFETVSASDRVELHHCTVLGNAGAPVFMATGCIFAGAFATLPPADEPLVLAGHTDVVNAVAAAPDGSLAVSGSDDRTLVVWDLATGAARHTLTGHGRSVTSVAITPDGRLAVSGSVDRRVRVWNLGSGSAIRTLPGHGATVTAVAINPSGRRIVSASRDRTLRIWDLNTGAVIHILAGHTDWVTAVAVTQNGTRLVSASRDRTVRVWDMNTGAIVHTLAGHTDWVTSVAITPDGARIVSASRDRTVRVWDLNTGAVIHILAGHAGTVNAVAITPDGSLVVSASQDRTLRTWDLAGGTLSHALSGHAGPVYAVAVTPDGTRAVSASGDDTLKEWDLASGTETHTFSGHTGRVNAAVILQAGDRVLSGSSDSTVRVWDLEREKLQSCIRYSRVPQDVYDDPGDNLRLAPPGSCTGDRPFFLKILFCPDGADPELRQPEFGEQGCGVLHPATPDSIWQGDEDGGEMGCYHHRNYSLSWSAAESKLADHLPLGITPVLIPDHTLARVPPRAAE